MTDMVKKYVPYAVIIFACLYAVAACVYSGRNAEVFTRCI